MDEPPIFVIILIVILATLVAGFIYLGGTLLIRVSSWVPMKTRLRWVAFSVAPLTPLAANDDFAVIIRKSTTASGAAERFGDAFSLVGLMGGLVVAGAIAANWLIFRRFLNATQESVYRKWQNAAEFFQSQAQRRPLEFIRYRGPNEKLETVADDSV